MPLGEVVVLVADHAGLGPVAGGIDIAASVIGQSVAHIADSAGVLHLSLAGSRDQAVARVLLKHAIVGAGSADSGRGAGVAHRRTGQAGTAAGEIKRTAAGYALSGVVGGAGCTPIEALGAVSCPSQNYVSRAAAVRIAETLASIAAGDTILSAFLADPAEGCIAHYAGGSVLEVDWAGEGVGIGAAHALA